MDAPELKADARFTSNALRVCNNEALVPLLERRFKEKPSAHWRDALDAAGIPAGPALAFDRAMADPHILARGMAVATEHPAAGSLRTLGMPVKLSDTQGALRRPAPRLGEHTAEVLGSLNRDQRGGRGRRQLTAPARPSAR